MRTPCPPARIFHCRPVALFGFLFLSAAFCRLPAHAWAQLPAAPEPASTVPASTVPASTVPDAAAPEVPQPGSAAQPPSASAAQPPVLPAPDLQPAGSITGIVTDSDDALVPGAHVTVSGEIAPGGQTTLSDSSGQFTFTGLAAGNFKLAASADGLATITTSGLLHGGEVLQLPAIVLPVASADTSVDVVLSHEEIAEIDVKAEEKQRLVGVLPNFFVAYNPKAPPLDAKQKYELSARTIIDPVSFLFVGATAGIQQATRSFAGYGQGAQGYAKRYGASFGDFAVGTLLGGAVFPSLLHQDPRYFYRGTGSIVSRTLYAMATAVICKGDNGHWQPNYSSVLGDFAAGGISNLYYPATNRRGLDVTLENGLISTLSDGLDNVIQELFLGHFTTKVARTVATQP